MTLEKFNESVSRQLNYCEALLIHKGMEYAPDDSDRLSAFKVAAALQDESPKQALCGMLAKHIVSVYEMCRSEERQPVDKWIEKLTDSINYLLILRAMVDDETNES